jgi:signal transduction histidine kinase
MFQNLPQVTKNILLLNIAFFVASLLLKSQGIDLEMTLGAHYVNSPFFEPYQIVTHFFMHSTDNFLHIFFNMWLFVMLGAYLENIWGAKRFFIFYLISAMGSFALYNMIGFIEIMNLKAALANQFDIEQFNHGSATRKVVSIFNEIGLGDDLRRARDGRNIRAGKGKMRGRVHKTPKSILLVVKEKSGLAHAVRNLPGVDVVAACNLSAEDLAPGGDIGRLTVFTKAAVEALN